MSGFAQEWFRQGQIGRMEGTITRYQRINAKLEKDKETLIEMVRKSQAEAQEVADQLSQ